MNRRSLIGHLAMTGAGLLLDRRASGGDGQLGCKRQRCLGVTASGLSGQQLKVFKNGTSAPDLPCSIPMTSGLPSRNSHG
jgi:hypothetical protein